MKVFFLVFLVTLYIHVIFNFDIEENIANKSKTSKYDEFDNDNAIKNTGTYTQKDLTASATAIVDAINEYFVKQSLTFDIVIFGEPEEKFLSLIDEIGKGNLNNYTTTIKQHNLQSGVLSLTQSALVFVNGKHLSKLLSVELRNKFRKNLKFLIYTDSHHALSMIPREQVISSNNQNYEGMLAVNYSPVLPFQYFLVDEKDKVQLTTFEWFTETKCNSMTYKVINRFDKTSLKWEKQLENHEKFKNLHNCIIAVQPYVGEYYNTYDGKLESFEFNMMDILATKLNFIQVKVNKFDDDSINHHGVRIIEQMKCDIKFGVYILTEYKEYHFTTTFAEESMLFMITPGELYTSYEKISMPFDELTWYFLFATFGAAFGVIFVVSFMPKRVRNYFYGDGVHLPAYNVVATFFGIGQMKLPTANFSRMIMMIYILFCLIIRTAYQGVMFDMMTKEMRKSSPQTIDEMFERNFNVNLITMNSRLIAISKPFYDVIDEYQRSKLNKYDINNCRIEICSTIFDPKRKFAVNVDQNLHKLITSWCEKSPEILDQKFMTIPMGIAMEKNHFLLEGLEAVMQHTIQAGIPQYWHKYHQWYQHDRNHYSEIEETGPTVFRLEDLSFGFIIWIISCGVAVLGLLGELLTFAISKMKKLAKVEPRKNKNTNKLQHKKVVKIKPKKPKIIQVRQQHKSTLDVQVLMEIQEKIADESQIEIPEKIHTKIENQPQLPLFEIKNEIKSSRNSTKSTSLDEKAEVDKKLINLKQINVESQNQHKVEKSTDKTERDEKPENLAEIKDQNEIIKNSAQIKVEEETVKEVKTSPANVKLDKISIEI